MANRNSLHLNMLVVESFDLLAILDVKSCILKERIPFRLLLKTNHVSSSECIWIMLSLVLLCSQAKVGSFMPLDRNWVY